MRWHALIERAAAPPLWSSQRWLFTGIAGVVAFGCSRGLSGPETPRPAASEGQRAEAANENGSPAAPPEPLAPTMPPLLSAPLPSEATLPNGLRLLALEQDRAPLVQVALVFRSGRADAEPGVAELTAAWLKVGGGNESSDTWRQRLDALGSTLSVEVKDESTRFALRARSEDFAAALGLLARAVVSPSPAAAFAHAKAALVAERKRPAAIDPEQVALKIVRERLFAPQAGRSGYAHPTATADELAAVSYADCVAFRREHYSPSNAALLVVGAVRGRVATRTAREVFGAWKRATRLTRSSWVPAAKGGFRIFAVNTPDLPLDFLALGALGAEAYTTDWSAFRSALYVLRARGQAGTLRKLVSAGASTPLHVELFAHARAPSLVVLSMRSRPQSVPDSARSLLQELHRLQREPPALSELLAARRRHAVERLAESDSLRGELERLTKLGRFELPASYGEIADAELMDLGAEAVRTAALKLDVENAVLVVAGAAKQTAATLQRLGTVTRVEP